MLSFTGKIRAYFAYTKRINYLFFCGFVLKPKASGVGLASRAKNYELNILEKGQKDGHFAKFLSNTVEQIGPGNGLTRLVRLVRSVQIVGNNGLRVIEVVEQW